MNILLAIKFVIRTDAYIHTTNPLRKKGGLNLCPGDDKKKPEYYLYTCHNFDKLPIPADPKPSQPHMYVWVVGSSHCKVPLQTKGRYASSAINPLVIISRCSAFSLTQQQHKVPHQSSRLTGSAQTEYIFHQTELDVSVSVKVWPRLHPPHLLQLSLVWRIPHR